MPLNAIVVGAGIGGLTAAIALRRCGLRVVVLEKRPSTDDGFALTIAPNATRILKALGVDLKLTRPVPIKQSQLVRCDAGNGDEPTSMHLEWTHVAEDYEQFSVHRNDYLAALRACALQDVGGGIAVDIRYGIAVASYDPVQGAVTLDSTLETISADVIVAADGLRSVAHKWVLNGEERPAWATSISNVRFCVPTKRILSNPRLAPILDHAGDGPTQFIGGEDHSLSVLRFPCRDNTLQNFGVYSFRGEFLSESSDKASRNARAIALDRLSNMGHALADLPNHVDEADMYIWKIFDRDPLPKLTSHRLALLGDACHPMRSMLGQGAAQAVEDAGILHVVFSGDVGPEDVPERLALWAELRSPRAAVAQYMSRCNLVGELGLGEREVSRLAELIPASEIPSTRHAAFAYFWKQDVMSEAWEKVKA